MDFVSFLSELAPVNAMQRLGFVLMHGVFFLILVRVVIRFLKFGNADFMTPLVHYSIGLVCIIYLPVVGQSLVSVTRTVSESIYADQNITEFLATEVNYYQRDGEDDPLAVLSSFLNGQTMVRFIARMFILAMLVVKIVLIDIIWQIFFAMTVMLGGITIPLTLAYGGNALTSWLRSLIELMLWPVIYSVLMLTMNSIIINGDGFILTYGGLEEDIKRISASWAVIFLTIMTPVMARAVMKGENAANAAEHGIGIIQGWSTRAVKTVQTGVKRRRDARAARTGRGRAQLNERM